MVKSFVDEVLVFGIFFNMGKPPILTKQVNS